MAEAIVRAFAEIGMRRMVGRRQDLPIAGDAIADRDLFAKEQAAAQFRPFAAAPIELAVMNGSPKSKLYEQAAGDIGGPS